MRISIQLNGTPLDLNDLDEFSPRSPFEATTIEFIKAWRGGQDHFEISTSGSTGKPKNIRITRSQMEASARLTIEALGLKPKMTALICLDTGFIAGKMMVVRAFVGNMDMIIQTPANNPLVNVHKQPDFAAMVPMQMEEIFKHPESVRLLNNMKAVILGGAPVSAALESQLTAVRPSIYATYGMTETVSHIALRHLNGAGRSNLYQAFDEVELNQDDRGCLEIKSVLTNHQKITTNDRVTLHGNNQFEWIGRMDNVINTGGIKVQSEEVERLVGQLFQEMKLSRRYYVCGTPDPKLGEKVTLILEGDKIENDQTILSALKKRSKKYAAPKEITYIPKFIETKTGKIHRQATLEAAHLNKKI